MHNQVAAYYDITWGIVHSQIMDYQIAIGKTLNSFWQET
jgi:hypothetical protein